MKIALLCMVGCAAALIVMLRVSPPRPADAQEPPSFVWSMNCLYRVQVAPVGVSIDTVFRIPPRDPAAPIRQIWIDLSLQNNNFRAGTFIGAGPFSPGDGAEEFVWRGMLPGRRHYYRMNALTPDGWAELGHGTIDTPDCHDIVEQTCDVEERLTVGFGLHDVPAVAADGTSGGGTFSPAEQWIDLSLIDNGFASGTFLGAGPFQVRFPRGPDASPIGSAFGWTGIAPGRQHYFRVNARYDGGGWMQRTRGSFLSLDCRNVPTQLPL